MELANRERKAGCIDVVRDIAASRVHACVIYNKVRVVSQWPTMAQPSTYSFTPLLLPVVSEWPTMVMVSANFEMV